MFDLDNVSYKWKLVEQKNPISEGVTKTETVRYYTGVRS